MQELGRVLIVAGVIAVLAGVVLMLAPRIPWLGRLPGDIVINRGPVSVYFPLATSIVISIVLTVVLNLFWRTWPSPALGLGLDLVMGLTLIAFMHRNVLAALAFLPCLAWVLFLTLPNLGHWHLG